MKYHVLLPRAQDVGAELDTAQWEQLLRAVGVNRAFMMVHGGDYAAATVADFLIFDERMPRSLAYCIDRMRSHLAHLAHNHAGETEADRILADMGARLDQAGIGEILEDGLHEFLTEFVADLIRLSDATARLLPLLRLNAWSCASATRRATSTPRPWAVGSCACA